MSNVEGQQEPGNRGREVRNQMYSIRLSLAVGLLMLAGKWYAYVLTNSSAIFSDAVESIVHVFAVGFAVYSLRLSFKPADKTHPYGHEKVSFFSAGVEGGLIIVAALGIIVDAVNNWIGGIELQRLSEGTTIVVGAALVNGGLGAFLVWVGRRHQSLVLIANGKHVLTDSWTSIGVIAGLLLVQLTGWKPFDPILALAVAVNILRSGAKLVRQSIGGLMDEGDPEIARMITGLLQRETSLRQLRFHELRYRTAGSTLWIEFHLLFPPGTTLEEAHRNATEIENTLKDGLDHRVNIITHLEPIVGHDEVHRRAGEIHADPS